MSKTFVFSELDDATREYLLAVRAREGKGMPGVFIKRSNSLPVIGCILGPIIIGVVLIATLFTDQVTAEPARLALLQTGGILLGGWMVLAAFRAWGASSSRSSAGYWTYVDPLFLYEATAEQVTVTAMSSVSEVTCVHNLNNDAYQNSVLTLKFEDSPQRTITVHDQRRAEAVVQYGNFLAWARGAEGFGQNVPAPAVLGGLAKYVSKNDALPLDAEGAVNLSAIELEVDEIPAEPQRIRSAPPNVLMYGILLVVGVASYFVLSKFIDPPLRDDAIYTRSTQTPMQPLFLRGYLADPRNTAHKDDIYLHLGKFYDAPIRQVRNGVRDPQLKAGMEKLFESLKTADLPVVSLRVVEQTSPPGDSNKDERSQKLRDLFVREVVDVLTQLSPPVGDEWDPKPPKMGEQLINFIETPADAEPHLEIRYQFVPEPGNPGKYHMKATVTIRDNIKGPNSWKGEVFFLNRSISAPRSDETLNWATQFADDLGLALLGVVAQKKPFELPPLD